MTEEDVCSYTKTQDIKWSKPQWDWKFRIKGPIFFHKTHLSSEDILLLLLLLLLLLFATGC